MTDLPNRDQAMTNRFNVRKAAVLGAGVMGAQIAAHFVNVGVPVVLFDLAAKDKDGGGALSSTSSKSGIVTRAIEGLKKLKPSPLGVPESAALIQAFVAGAFAVDSGVAVVREQRRGGPACRVG